MNFRDRVEASHIRASGWPALVVIFFTFMGIIFFSMLMGNFIASFF